MSDTVEAPDGGYGYVPGVSQYSCGVAALPGFRIERVQFANPVPLAQGFECIERHLKEAGRRSSLSVPASYVHRRRSRRRASRPSTKAISACSTNGA